MLQIPQPRQLLYRQPSEGIVAAEMGLYVQRHRLWEKLCCSVRLEQAEASQLHRQLPAGGPPTTTDSTAFVQSVVDDARKDLEQQVFVLS